MILKLEDQVCSLESAKRLKELGFRQESLFHWAKSSSVAADEIIANDRFATCLVKEFYSAYTCAELGELLPVDIRRIETSYDGQWCATRFGIRGMSIHTTRDSNEAEARAKMLIYLAENKLIEVVE